MATIAAHLSVDALRERYVSSSNAREARHFHAIWLLAKGHTLGEVAEMTSFGQRWIEQLAARYNAEGPESLGDLRRRNGSTATVLKPESARQAARSAERAARRRRLVDERESRGFSRARIGAGEGRGSARLGSAESLRHVDPGSTPQKSEVGFARGGGGVQKNLEDAVAEEAAKHPERSVEVFASDEHRLGLKPVTRRVWAPVGERPIAHGHHRFDWLYVTAFVSPASGETFWYVHDGVSKPFFAALLETFAREAKAGVDRTIVLVIDNAGWHGEAGLSVPDGVRLVFLPPYTPELQPAETLWALVDEPIVNKHIGTIEELDAIIGERCAALASERDIIKSRAGFHWWPKIAKPK